SLIFLNQSQNSFSIKKKKKFSDLSAFTPSIDFLVSMILTRLCFSFCNFSLTKASRFRETLRPLSDLGLLISAFKVLISDLRFYTPSFI
ncbi:hypothetical protein GIB67_036991, partial [Kingdonia uniflora]